MRGKKAKEIRRMARGIATGNRLPDLLLTKKRVGKRMLVNTASGPQQVIIPIPVRELGECLRKVYKDLKRDYKRGVDIYA